MKKVLLGIVGALLAFVAVSALVLLTLDLDAVINAQRDKITASVSAALGRDVELGPITTTIFPRLGATITEVKLAGPTPESASQVEVGAVDIQISLLKAIVSLGKDLEVDQIAVKSLVIRATRDEDGNWDFDDIVQSLNEGQTPEEEKDPNVEQPPKDLSFLEGARLSRIALESARIEIDDAQLGRPLAVGALDIELLDIRLGAPIEVSLSAIMEDGDNQTPISIAFKLAELRKDLSFDPMPDIALAATVDNLDVAPWAALLPADALKPVAGIVDIDLQGALTEGVTRIKALGNVELKEVVLAQGKAKGKPLSVKVVIDADADTQKPRYEIREVKVDGTGINLAGSATANGTSPADLEVADLKLAIQDLARVVAVVPQEAPLLPKELTLDGPVAAHVKGNASVVDLVVNLDGAHVAWADAFDKKRGRPLNLKLKGKKSAKKLDIEGFQLAVDAAKLEGKLGLPISDGAPLTADLKSGKIPFASLKDLLPPIEKALGKGNKVNGHVAIVASAKVVGDKQDAEVKVSLGDLDVHIDGFDADGSGVIDAKVVPHGDTTDLKVDAKLDGLALKSVDGNKETVLDKPAGMPLRADVAVVHTPKKATINKAELQFGSTLIKATGGASKLDTDSPALDIDLGTLNVAFNDLRRTVPGAAQLPKNGSLKGKVKIGGQPKSLKTMVIDAKDVDLSFSKTAVKGDVKVSNLDKPAVDANLPVLKLDFDDIRELAPDAKDALPRGGKFDGAVKAKVNTAKMSTLDADVTINTLVYKDAEVKGTLGLKNLDAPTFHFDLSSPYLNIDELAGLDENDGKSKKSKEKKKKKEPGDNEHGLPDDLRATLKKVNGKGKLKVGKAIVSGMTLKDFVGELTMKDGVLEFQALDFGAYDGTVSAGGSRFDLPAKYTGYRLNLKTRNIDLNKAVEDNSDLRDVFEGRVSNTVAVSGKGIGEDDLKRSLTGLVGIDTDKLTIKTLDVLGPIGDPVKKALEKVGYANFQGFAPQAASSSSSRRRRRGAQAASQALNGTTLKDVAAQLEFDAGDFKLKKPLTTKTNFGSLYLSGGGGLDNHVNMTAKAILDKDVINQAMKSNAVNQSVEVPLHVGGTFDKPRVTGVDAKTLVQKLVGGAAAEAMAELEKQAKAEAEKLAKEAEDQAKKAKAKAEKEAKKAAEAAKKKAEEEAKKAADKAKKKAKKEADKAKKKAKKKLKEWTDGLF